MAFVAAGGSPSWPGFPNGPINGAPALPEFHRAVRPDRPGGITLNIFGGGGLEGPDHLLTSASSSAKATPTTAPTSRSTPQGDTLLAGQGVPYGWLVTPHAGTRT